MKVLSNAWGADRICMLHFYQALICSCLIYECMSYQSVWATILKMLSAAHHSFICLSTGTFCSSPVLSLLVDNGEPSLWNRWNQFIYSCGAGIKVQPNHPTFDAVFSNQHLNGQQEQPRSSTALLGIRCLHLFLVLNIQLPPVLTVLVVHVIIPLAPYSG